MESVIGDVFVSARLTMGSERMRLLLTSSRIVVSHIGKRGTGALAATTIFGRLSAALEDLLKGGRESLERQKTKSQDPALLLEADPDNFDIPYDEVVEVTLEEGPRVSIIKVLTRDEKFEFLSFSTFNTIVSLFSRVLEDRTKVSRI